MSYKSEAVLAAVVVALVVIIIYIFGKSDVIISPATTMGTTISMSSTSVYTTTIPPGVLGELAGQLNFALVPGTSGALQFALVNDGGLSINVTVGLQGSLKSQNKSAITPVVTFNPTTIEILPHATNYLNVSVFIPTNDVNGTSWSGFLSAQCLAGCSGGVAKAISIAAT